MEKSAAISTSVEEKSVQPEKGMRDYTYPALLSAGIGAGAFLVSGGYSAFAPMTGATLESMMDSVDALVAMPPRALVDDDIMDEEDLVQPHSKHSFRKPQSATKAESMTAASALKASESKKSTQLDFDDEDEVDQPARAESEDEPQQTESAAPPMSKPRSSTKDESASSKPRLSPKSAKSTVAGQTADKTSSRQSAHLGSSKAKSSSVQHSAPVEAGSARRSVAGKDSRIPSGDAAITRKSVSGGERRSLSTDAPRTNRFTRVAASSRARQSAIGSGSKKSATMSRVAKPLGSRSSRASNIRPATARVSAGRSARGSVAPSRVATSATVAIEEDHPIDEAVSRPATGSRDSVHSVIRATSRRQSVRSAAGVKSRVATAGSRRSVKSRAGSASVRPGNSVSSRASVTGEMSKPRSNSIRPDDSFNASKSKASVGTPANSGGYLDKSASVESSGSPDAAAVAMSQQWGAIHHGLMSAMLGGSA